MVDLERGKDAAALAVALLIVAFLFVFRITHSRIATDWRIWPADVLANHGLGWLVTGSEIFAFGLLAVVVLLELRDRSPW